MLEGVYDGGGIMMGRSGDNQQARGVSEEGEERKAGHVYAQRTVKTALTATTARTKRATSAARHLFAHLTSVRRTESIISARSRPGPASQSSGPRI